MSDLDFLVVTADDEPVPHLKQLSAFENRRVEVFFRTKAELVALAENVQGGVRGRDDDFPPDAREELDFCQRVRFGYTVLAHPLLDAVRDALIPERIAQLVEEGYRAEALTLFKRASILERIAERDASVACLRRAVAMAAHAYAAANGEHYVPEKFLSMKLDRIEARGGEVDWVRSLLYGSWIVPGAPSLLDAAAAALSKLGVQCPLDGIDELLLEQPPDVAHWKLGDEGYVAIGDSYLFHLDPDANALWQDLSFGAPLRIWQKDSERSRACRTFQLLHRYGLITLRFRSERTAWKRQEGVPSTLAFVTPRGVRFHTEVTEPVVRLPFTPKQFLGAGIMLLQCGHQLENSREDASGAYDARQWGLLESAIARIVERAAGMILAGHGVSPFPLDVYGEAVRRLAELPTAPPDFVVLAHRLQDVRISNVKEADDVIRALDQLVQFIPAALTDPFISESYERGQAFLNLMLKAAEWLKPGMTQHVEHDEVELSKTLVAFANGQDGSRFKPEHLMQMLAWERRFTIGRGTREDT
jgi:hypothetical protein